MIYNKIIVFLIITVFINILYSENKIAIVVKSSQLDIYSKAVVEHKLMSYLSEIDKYTVVERKDLPAVITEREFQKFYNNNNDYSINNFTAADYILICNIYSIENRYSLNLKIEKIKTGEILAAASTFTELTITELINSIPLLIAELLKQQFSINELPEEIKLFSLPIRNTNSFLNDELIKLYPSVSSGSIDNIFIINNSLLTISSPLKITEYHNYLNGSLPARIVFEYQHWETIYSCISVVNQLFAATVSDGTICLWNINDWGPPYQLSYSDKRATAITFNHSGLMLYVGFSNGTIDFIDSNTFEIVDTDNICNNKIVYMNSISSGLIIIDEYQNIYLYNVNEKKVVATYNSFDSQFSTIGLSNEKNILAIGHINGLIKLYHISKIITTKFIDGVWANPYIRYKGKFILPGEIKSFDFSNSDDIIAVLMEKNSIEYIDLINKKVYHSLSDSTNNINNNVLKFVDDYNIILGSNDGKIMIRTIK